MIGSILQIVTKSILCDLSVNKIIENDSKQTCDPKLYREIVGSLIYIMTGTRPDLSYVVTKLAQHMSSPTKTVLGLGKHVLIYLKGAKYYYLKFKKTDFPLRLIGHCDSDWGTSTDRRGITGYCYISWNFKKQATVALLSCEAEYVSMTSAIQKGKFLCQLSSDIQNTDRKVITLKVNK